MSNSPALSLTKIAKHPPCNLNSLWNTPGATF